MRPEDYDAWYDSSRGHWIGETEFASLPSLEILGTAFIF
jgi:hypothetical protein